MNKNDVPIPSKHSRNSSEFESLEYVTHLLLLLWRLGFPSGLMCSFICPLFIDHVEKTPPPSYPRNMQTSWGGAGILRDTEL